MERQISGDVGHQVLIVEYVAGDPVEVPVEAVTRLIVESPARAAGGTRLAWLSKTVVPLRGMKSVRLEARE